MRLRTNIHSLNCSHVPSSFGMITSRFVQRVALGPVVGGELGVQRVALGPAVGVQRVALGPAVGVQRVTLGPAVGVQRVTLGLVVGVQHGELGVQRVTLGPAVGVQRVTINHFRFSAPEIPEARAHLEGKCRESGKEQTLSRHLATLCLYAFAG